MGGLDFSLAGFSADPVPVLFAADRDDAEVLAVSRSRVCNSLDVALDATGPAVLPMGALFLAAFSGGERLTLNVC